MAEIAEIIDNFSILDDWDDRYRYLIELGRELPPLPAAAHNDANKVQGCASQVWLDTTVRPNGAGGPVLTFEGDSDAHIVRGLIAILFATYSGKAARAYSRHRRDRLVRKAGLKGTSHAAALERLSLDGGAYPLGCAGGACDGRLKRSAVADPRCSRAADRVVSLPWAGTNSRVAAR